MWKRRCRLGRFCLLVMIWLGLSGSLVAQDGPDADSPVVGQGTFTLPGEVFSFDVFDCFTAPTENPIAGTFDFQFRGKGVSPAGRPFGIAGWQVRKGNVVAQEMVVGVQPGPGEPTEMQIPGTDQTMPMGPVRMMDRKVIRQEDGAWKWVGGGEGEPGPFLEADGLAIRGRTGFSGPRADDPRGRSVKLGIGVLEVNCNG